MTNKKDHGAETLRALRKAVLKYRESVEGKLCDSSLTAMLLYLASKNTTSGDSLLGLYELAVAISPVPPFPKPDLNILPLINEHFASFRLSQAITLPADAYQIWRTKERKDALSRIQSADKTIDLEALIAFTQIYTPDWVVNYLIEQTFSTRDENDDNFTFLDPACGAGHFVLAAFDRMIADKIPKDKAALKKRVENILRYRLHAIDLDRDALFVLSIALAARLADMDLSIDFKPPGLTLLSLEETDCLGSLSRNEKKHPVLARRYDLILTNPPYIGRKLISRELKLALKQEYPEASSDLSAAFLERSLEMLSQEGCFAAITQASVLTLPTYRKLRKNILESYKLSIVVDLGPGVFPNQTGEKIDSALIVAENKNAVKEEKMTFFNLRKSVDKRAELEKNLKKSTVSLKTISGLYNHSFHQGIPESLARFWKRTDKLESSASIKQGLATTDNSKFLRLIWHIDRAELYKRWYPYAKGAGGERWFSPILHVVDWQDDGSAIKEAVSRKYPYLKGKFAWVVKNEDYYFKPGLVFSFVNRSGLAVRKLPAGCIFDVGASAIFPDDHNDTDVDFLLGYLNSSLPGSLLKAINPTINNQVGDLKILPCPLARINKEDRVEIADMARRCHDLKRTIYETTSATALYLPDRHRAKSEAFPTYESWRKSIETLETDLFKLEQAINKSVFNLFSKTGDFKSAEVESWLEERLTKPADLCFNSFLSLFLTASLMKGERLEPDCIADLDSLCGKGLNSFIKSDLPLYIKRSFLGSPPQELTGELAAKLLPLVASRSNEGR
ncbi:N-6 DNA methylase [bacterium]|nr:N-6 DNA methylase [bacterium]